MLRVTRITDGYTAVVAWPAVYLSCPDEYEVRTADGRRIESPEELQAERERSAMLTSRPVQEDDAVVILTGMFGINEGHAHAMLAEARRTVGWCGSDIVQVRIDGLGPWCYIRYNHAATAGGQSCPACE